MDILNCEEGEQIRQILPADGWKVFNRCPENWGLSSAERPKVDTASYFEDVIFWALTFNEDQRTFIHPVTQEDGSLYFADEDAGFICLVPPGKDMTGEMAAELKDAGEMFERNQKKALKKNNTK